LNFTEFETTLLEAQLKKINILFLRMPKKPNASSELQGLTRLLIAATISTIDIVEAMHKRVVNPPFIPSTPIQKLITNMAGIAYTNTRFGTKLIGKGIDKLFGQLGSLLGEFKVTSEKEAIQSILNGVVGDYLEENENPLKINMEFRNQGKALSLNILSLKEAYPAINGKILVMVHGSCMNDLQWTQKQHNHGIALASELNKTPLFLNYNSGRHISKNGQDLTNLLEELVLNWPVPIEELNIVGHSMGGLVARSAIFYGHQFQKSWITYAKKICFLGTPHQGATMEKVGNYLDVILESIPYAKPFAKLGKVRSAGVTDLRYGNIIDEDWQNGDRFKLEGDRRQNVPLQNGLIHYSIAASIGKSTNNISSKLMGDNLVSIKSALGQHKDPSKNLNFKETNTRIAYECNHVGLLSNAEVFSQLKKWMI
jgi:hypothetical protein